jgi:dipeptidyl aminopeptidase/acylaminoacyl peptidase
LLDEVERRKPRIAAQPGAPDVYEPPRQIEITDENGRMLACRDPRCDGDVRNPMLLATGEVAFLRLEGFARADTALYVWTPRTGAVRSLRLSEEMLACVAGARIYCLREAAREPRSLVAIDPATGAVTALYDPNPQWARFRDVRIERLNFTDARGLQSFAHLVYPAGYRPGRLYPLVIVQYRSRGFLRAGTGGEFPIFPMAARGYFVLSVERPEDHARGRELSYAALQREQELSGEENRMKLDAIDAFIAEAERRHLIDSGRIAITGLSDASETLYLALLRRSFAAASAASPPTDRSAWWLQSQAFRARLAATLGAEPPWDSGDEWRRWWEANSIAEHADEIATPLLFNLSHAEALGALPLYVRLRERNVPAEIFLYPDAYHLKWRPLQVLASQERTIAWFEFWLRGVETADPDDPERIERWRALRAASAPARAP